jgi:hypothetical protein
LEHWNIGTNIYLLIRKANKNKELCQKKLVPRIRNMRNIWNKYQTDNS